MTKKCLKANVVVLVKQLVLMVGIFNFLEGAKQKIRCDLKSEK